MKIEAELIIEAEKIVKKYNNYSTSFLQRKLGVGYNLAREIMELVKPEAGKGGDNTIDTVKIAVVGSRDFDDYELFSDVMDDFLSAYGEVTFVSGGSRGADKLAERYAEDHDIDIVIFKAE